MKLIDLEPELIKREIRACAGPGTLDCSTVSPHNSHEYHIQIETVDEADGIIFLCPKCFTTNNGSVGTHYVLCWRPRIPPDIAPKPGRWELLGTSINDLSLRAGSSSILLHSDCTAHFFIENGMIRMC